jgi:glycosyltransferase involved in cell wall biosynthesis
MKIAYIGIAYVYYESHFLKLLDAHYDVDFFFYGGEERYIGKEVRSYADKKPALARAQYLKGFHVFPRLKITPGLIAKLWRGNYDVIIKGIVGRFALPASFITAKLLGKKFILLTDIWQHPRSLAHCFSYWLLKAVYRYSDAICAYGNHVRDFVVSQGAREEKIFVMPFATDNALFDRTVAPQEKLVQKKTLGIEGKKVIIFVGRLVREKGVEYLLRAHHLLARDDVAIVIVGEGKDKQRLQALAKELHIDDRVKFIGQIGNNKLYKLYALADIFVLPSVRTRMFAEPWGMVVNEAMNQGLPIVVTESVGAGRAGLVAPGENGLVVKEKDPRALCDAFKKILDDDAFRARMQDASRAIIKDYTPERMYESMRQALVYVTHEEKTDRSAEKP